MAKHRLNVTQKREERLPDWSAEYAVMISQMRQRGLLDEIARRLRVPREGGYSDIDIVVFLVCFFCSQIGSQKDFGRRSSPYRKQLAALADRKEMPTPSSVSRYLNSAGTDQVQPFVDWLLLSSADGQLLSDERGSYRDSHGQSWWVFDWDPTVITVRKRGLPTTESLPEAKRRAAKAKPGYSGRKRGEAQFCRSIIEQAASAQPVGMKLQSGNGEFRELIDHAVNTVVQTVQKADLPRRHTLLRVDGIGGCVPFISRCNQQSVRYLSRLSRYHWLELPQVNEHIERGDWQPVEDSKSGPTREAMDLGWVKIHPDRRSQKADGSAYEPVKARVVISRFEPTDPERDTGSGKRIGRWHYEMYVTDIAASRWPAADVVSLYYARAGCENHYAQMGREQGINRLFCYEPAGQLLATALGLWLFSEQAEWGFELDDAPSIKAEPRPRSEGFQEQQNRRAEGRQTEPPVPVVEEAGDADVSVISQKRAESVLQRFDGPWRWDGAVQGFICPAEQHLCARKIKDSSVIFAASRTACRGCEFRGGASEDGPRCTGSTKPDFRKEISVAVDSQDIERIDLNKLRQIRPAPQSRLEFEPLEAEAGPWQMMAPRLMPARYRKAIRQACQDVEVEVRMEPTNEPPPALRTVEQIRQRRRLSWKQRHLRGALRDHTVHLTMRAGPILRRLMSSLEAGDDDGYLIEMSS